MLKSIIFDNPTIQEIQTGYEELMKQPESKKGKVKVYFSEPVQLRINRHKANTKQVFELKFFEATNGRYCYTTYNRTGYPLSSNMLYEKIIKMEVTYHKDVVEKDKTQKAVENLLKQRYDEHTWSHLTSDGNFESTKRKYMKTIFPQYVIDELETAFKEKRNFSHRKYGPKRDYSLETKMGDDGIYRGWFSSEFSGTGNGDYYLLLNPNLAAFGERD